VQGWAVPAGSVVEMEMLQREVTSAQFTFLGVGVSDLNDNYVSDYRADIVPFSKGIRELREAQVDWTFARKVLAQYPLKYLRAIYPTAGRSMHVMVGVREVFRNLRGRKAAEPNDQAVLTSESNTHGENIGSWPEARILRNIALTRDSAGGTFSFHGPKRDALFRFLEHGKAQGKMVVLVFPESPFYEKEFVTEKVRADFEALLAEAQQRTPEALWVRLDRVPEFKSADYYWDLVHLNAPGQAQATQIVRKKLAAAGIL
jgi:uncharacterized short protein YbdD (DUF466 family)